jgi:hypothetical protein
VPTPGRVSTLEAPARALRQTVGAGRDNRRVNETQNQEQQTAPAAAEQRDVAEKSMAALLASDANQAVVGLAVVGAAAGAKKIVDKLRGPGSGGQGGGQDGGTKPRPPAND